VDDDGGFSIDRAFVFTDAATRAFLFLHDGALLVITHNGMVGTLLVADEADFILIPGNAPGLIDVSNTHLDETLFFNGKGPNRFGGTDPSAKIAELLTIANTRNEPGRIEARQPRLEKS
jgi:hypothetical protein